jgi:tetratricopeptide (TPR) repeat protein
MKQQHHETDARCECSTHTPAPPADLHRQHPARTCIAALLTGLSILCLPPALHSADETGRDESPRQVEAIPAEPTVNEKEADLLNKAETAAETDPAQAVKLLREGISEESSAALTFALAAYLFRQGEDAQGVEALRETLQRMPRFLRARESLARALVTQERWNEALVELRRLLLEPGTDIGQTWQLTAYCLMTSGQYLAAETAYRQALVWQPDNQENKRGLLKAILAQGRTQDAAELAEPMMRKQPDDPQLWRLSANAALEQGHPLDALVTLESARKLGLADDQMTVTIADLYMDQGLPAPALEAYRQAAAFDNAPVGRLLRGLEAMVATGNDDEAESMAQTLETKRRDLDREQDIQLTRLQARLDLLRGNTEQAKKRLARLIAEDPLDADSVLQLADMLREEGKLDEADALYERAVPLPRFRVRALTGLAQSAVERNQYAKALRYVQEALQQGPNPALERYLNEIRDLL